MYTIIIQRLYTLQRNHHHQSSFYPLPHSWLLSPIWPTPNPQFVYDYLYFSITPHNIGLYFHHQSHPQLGVVFALVPSSFFLELFLYWSPVAYWAPTDLGSISFSFISFCLFILFMGFSRQEWRSSFPLPSPVDHVLWELSTRTCPSWVALHSMADSYWVRQGYGLCNQFG